VNKTIIVAMIRQRLESPLRMVILFMTMGLPLLTVAFAPGAGLSAVGNCYAAVLVFAAGMIGQDLSSGTLQLLLARPVTRAEYVLSKWAGAAGGAIAVVLLQIIVVTALMAAHGVPPDVRAAGLFLAGNVLLAIGVAAVMALLSTLVPGFGDLGLLVLAFFSAIVMQGIGSMKEWPAVTRAATEIQNFINPQLDLPQLVHGPLPWLSIVSYLSTVTLSLALAIVVLNRRELSYASSGG
jgi:ABC-type transport system involved in multi-copper enzyme maturation permease subunit